MTSSAQPLQTLIVEHNPNNQAMDSAVIWLHGLGASYHDFEPIVPQLGLNQHLAVRFIFPQAPNRPVTINGGMSMPAWYDIIEMSLDRKVDVAQIQISAEQVTQLIQEQITQGIDSNRIILAGFSQGGAVVYHTGLSYPKPLAGLLCLSTYLATPHQITYHPANQNTPIKIDHGTHDPVVPAILAQQAYKLLQSQGYDVNFSTFSMAHQVCMPQIHQIGEWLNDLLG